MWSQWSVRCNSSQIQLQRPRMEVETRLQNSSFFFSNSNVLFFFFLAFKIVMNIVNFSSSESVVDFNFRWVIEKFILLGKLNLMQILHLLSSFPSLLTWGGLYQRNNLLHRLIIHGLTHFVLHPVYLFFFSFYWSIRNI